MLLLMMLAASFGEGAQVASASMKLNTSREGGAVKKTTRSIPTTTDANDDRKTKKQNPTTEAPQQSAVVPAEYLRLLRQAMELQQQRDINGAQQVLQHAYTAHPSRPDAFILQARLYRNIGRVGEAVALLQKAIASEVQKTKPKEEQGGVWSELAQLIKTTGPSNAHHAIGAYEQALAYRLDPYDLSDLGQLHADGHIGANHGAIGSEAEKKRVCSVLAMRYFDQALRLAPSLHGVWSNFGNVQHQRGNLLLRTGTDVTAAMQNDKSMDGRHLLRAGAMAYTRALIAGCNLEYKAGVTVWRSMLPQRYWKACIDASAQQRGAVGGTGLSEQLSLYAYNLGSALTDMATHGVGLLDPDPSIDTITSGGVLDSAISALVLAIHFAAATVKKGGIPIEAPSAGSAAGTVTDTAKHAVADALAATWHRHTKKTKLHGRWAAHGDRTVDGNDIAGNFPPVLCVFPEAHRKLAHLYDYKGGSSAGSVGSAASMHSHVHRHSPGLMAVLHLAAATRGVKLGLARCALVVFLERCHGLVRNIQKHCVAAVAIFLRLILVPRPFTHKHAHTRTHTRTHAHAHTHTHTRTHARTHTHAHTRAHTRTPLMPGVSPRRCCAMSFTTPCSVSSCPMAPSCSEKRRSSSCWGFATNGTTTMVVAVVAAVVVVAVVAVGVGVLVEVLSLVARG